MKEKYRIILCLREGEVGGGVDYRPVCRIYFPTSAPVCLSFMAPVIVSKCSEDAFHFIVHIHTPNSHTLLLKESLQNDSFCLDSFLIKVGKIIRKS